MAHSFYAKLSMARGHCEPKDACRECILCQRCGLCVAHCTCPPVRMRKTTKKAKSKYVPMDAPR